MASRLQLRVLRTILDAIETLLREILPLFLIYVTPWLAWTLTLIAIDRSWAGSDGTGISSDLVTALAFAPFGAAITVTTLRRLMQPLDGFFWWRLDQTWVWATALYAFIGAVNYGIGQVSYAWLMANADVVVAGTKADSTVGQRLAWMAIGLLPSWIATLFAYLALSPQAAVIVERGAPSGSRQWQLMRLAPWSILAVAVLVGICRLGASFSYGSLMFPLYTWDGPLADATFGWRHDLAVGLWRALVALPVQLLTDALTLVALARVYNALARYADRTRTVTVEA